MFFDGRACGWTESHWYNSSTGSHNLTMDKAKILAGKRARLLGTDCRIKAIRVSTEGSGPDACLEYIDYKPNYAKDSSGKLIGPTAAQKDVAVQLRMQDQDCKKWKLTFLRGCWDIIESENGDYQPTDAWKELMEDYTKYLRLGEWGWYGSVSKVKKNLSNVQRGITTDSAVFTFQAAIFPDALVGKRTKVRIAGVNGGRSNLNAVHVVSVVDTSTASTEFPLAVANLVTGGWGTYNAYDFIGYSHVDDQKVVTRETGAPLLESPGRRKRKARG